MKDYFVRSFRYNAWANQQTLTALRECLAAQPENVPLLAHLFAAEHVWLSRLLANEPTFVVWPSLTIDECQTLAIKNERTWADYFESVTDNGLNATVEYRNSHGESFSNSVMDILTHVTVHGGYHRGQIAKGVRRGGGTPASTDFIIFARNNAPSAT
jgi:uncharacterized damage-inducible protein DinB